MAVKTKRKPTPAAIEAGRKRRVKTATERAVRIEWFIEEANQKVSLTMKKRVRIATGFVKDRVIRNIGRPVTKGKGPLGGKVVTNRSKAGEFPKADTTQLLKTIFDEVKQTSPGVWDGFVGTTLDYGVILELRKDRSFLVRTLNEELVKVKAILSGPIK